MTSKKDIEGFIKEHRQEFDTYVLNNHHEEKFLIKLSNRFKKFISIVPYLVKVFIVTIFIFFVSIIVWDNYIRKDRNEFTLKEKIVLTYQKFINNKK